MNFPTPPSHTSDPSTPRPGGRWRSVSWPRAGGRFGFLFRDLRRTPWAPAGADPAAEIAKLARTLYAESDPNPNLPAAYSFFGQFLAHDLSFDARHSIAHAGGSGTPNFRSPLLDLDSLYGAGPRVQPYLYSLQDPRRFLIGRNRSGELDLPRNADGSADGGGTNDQNRRRRALIADPRNDENTIVSQLHLAFLRFHNAHVEEGGGFRGAQRLTRWHYQWVIVHDYLKRLCGSQVIDDVFNGGRPQLDHYDPTQGRIYMPIEFSFALFRMGHSMVGSGYHLSDSLEAERNGAEVRLLVPGIGATFRDRDPVAHNSLGGDRELPPDWTVQWDRFLETGGNAPQLSRRIDTRIAPELEWLPIPRTRSRDERSLAYRTLLRNWKLELPSGQRVADFMGISDIVSGDDALWHYVLREAEAFGGGAAPDGGKTLGPMAGRLVAETFIGLLAADKSSFLNAMPAWRPAKVDAGGSYELVDFLRDAGAPISASDWSDRKTVDQ